MLREVWSVSWVLCCAAYYTACLAKRKCRSRVPRLKALYSTTVLYLD